MLFKLFKIKSNYLYVCINFFNSTFLFICYIFLLLLFFAWFDFQFKNWYVKFMVSFFLLLQLTELKPKLVTVVPRNLQHTLTDTPSPNTVTDTPVMTTPSPITVMDTSPSHLTIPAFTITNPIRPKQWAFSIYSTKILHPKMPTWDTITTNLKNPHLFKLFKLYFYSGSAQSFFYVIERWIETWKIINYCSFTFLLIFFVKATKIL